MSWIDFKALRDKLDFPHLLQHYNVEYKTKGDRGTAFCPLPSHNGKRRSPSFSADLKRGLFQCFGCGAKGNILEFACLMENVDPQNSREFHRVATMLQEKFITPAPRGGGRQNTRGQSDGRREPQRQVPPQRKPTAAPAGKPPSPPQRNLPVVVNSPLDFELKNLDSEHPYLRNRGLTPATVKQFGLGFCNRGSMKERIAIPLHDQAGKLIGYAGRLVDDTKISEDSPKYLFPGDREHDGKLHEFKKSHFLYNGYRIRRPVEHLVVVEGFPATWWLWQNGCEAVVALMGSSCSKEQGALIVKLVRPEGTVWVLTDGDDAGRRCAGSIFVCVGSERLVRYFKPNEGEQPTDWTPEEILGSLGSAQEESDQSDEPVGESLCERSTGKAQDPTTAR
jgi:DNA primase